MNNIRRHHYFRIKNNQYKKLLNIHGITKNFDDRYLFKSFHWSIGCYWGKRSEHGTIIANKWGKRFTAKLDRQRTRKYIVDKIKDI